jgi:hypothetical protein
LYTTPVIYLYLDRLQHYFSPTASDAKMPRMAQKLRGATAAE